MPATIPQPKSIHFFADTFFNSLDAENTLKPLSTNRLTRQSLSRQSSMRNKLASASDDAAFLAQARRRSQHYENTTANNQANDLIAAVMSPATSSGVATKREQTRFPATSSVVFKKTSSLSQQSPLPGPKRSSFSNISSKRAAAKTEDEMDSAASRPRSRLGVKTTSTTASVDLYMSATSNLSYSGNDLSALRSAVQALKSSSLSSAPVRSTAAAAVPAPCSLPQAAVEAQQQPETAKYVPLQKPATIKSTRLSTGNSRSSTLDALQQRMAKIHLASSSSGVVAAAPVVFIASISPPASAAVEKYQEPEEEEEEHSTAAETPPSKAVPNTPLAPANTPASPRFKPTSIPRLPRAAAANPPPSSVPAALSKVEHHHLNEEEEEDSVVLASPAHTEYDAYTEYDGDDVLMGGDSTPAESISGASTVSRDGGSGASTGGARSSRFRIEALRQGVTPLRMRGQDACSPPRAPLTSGGGAADGAEEHIQHVPSLLQQQQSPTVSTSTTMSSNPLAQMPSAPVAEAQSAEIDSPAGAAVSSSSTSGISNNNPLFAGTPSHPTPPSVTMVARRHSLSMGAAAAAAAGVGGTTTTTPATTNIMRTPSTGGSSAASAGMLLAERLHAAAEKLQTPVQQQQQHSSDDNTMFQFKGDVQALLLALDANTPKSVTPVPRRTGAAARAMAAASTEERPKAQPRRRSSTLSPGNTAPILDLNGYDVNGERTAPGQATPLFSAAGCRGDGYASKTHFSNHNNNVTTTTSNSDTISATAVAALKHQISGLEAEREEAASLLSTYQGTIADLQDRHSAVLVRLQTENALLKSESERLRCERAEVNTQFETLYRDKYAPLKTEAAALRRGADALRARLMEEGGKVKRIAQLEAELSLAQAATAAAQQSAAAFKSEADAARKGEAVAEQRAAEAAKQGEEAERRWAAKFATEAARAEQALASKGAEVSAWKDKHTAMARQHDAAVHRAHLAQAAKERKSAEVGRKEEEICALEVRLHEVECVLGQYRAENEKFSATKEKYKSVIAALERELATKDAEKATLASMCNELLERLEEEEEKK